MFGKKIPVITVKELKERLDNNEDIYMVDLRRPGEWIETGVIQNSRLITDQKLLKDIDFGNLGEELENEKEVILICRSGNRSGRMTSFFRDHRNIKAINLRGGIIAWKRNGFAVVQPVD